MKPGVYYEARLVGQLSAILSCLAIPAYTVLMRLWYQYDDPSPDRLYKIFAILLPLASGLAATHLMSIESEAGFCELRLTYPEPRLRLPFLRSAAAVVFMLLATILGLAAVVWLWGLPDFNSLSWVLHALPPTVFLSGLSLLVGGLSRSYWAATGTVLGWWFLELQTRGQLTGVLFLFHPIWPRTGVSAELNQAFLSCVGVGFFLLNVILYTTQGGWSVRRHRLGAR